MRRALRVAAVVLLAFLLQSTMLSYFKVSGVVLDALTIALCSVGYALGIYAGLTAGLLGALLMEVMAGDLHGIMAVVCVGAGAWGAWAAGRIGGFTRVGNRMLERLVRRFAPMLAIGLFVLIKESVYVFYFYLTGVDIGFMHFFRAIFGAILAAVFSLLLLPVTYWFLMRRPEDTFLARLFARRQAKARPRPVAPGPRQPGRPMREGRVLAGGGREADAAAHLAGGTLGALNDEASLDAQAAEEGGPTDDDQG